MARAGKKGIDYFSHDVDMISDRKIRLLKAKHKLIGYAVFLRLLEEIYRENGYYIEVNDEFNLLFCDDNGLELDYYQEILNDCIEFGLFEKGLFEKYRVLSSKRIQLNYLMASSRRKKAAIYKEYLLVDFASENIKAENVDILTLNVNILGLNDDIGTQIEIEREIEIEKEIERERESKKTHTHDSKIKHLDSVLLTTKEYDCLKTELGQTKADDYIQRLNDYIASTGKKYKSHYHTIKNWVRRDEDQVIIKLNHNIDAKPRNLNRFIE